MGRGHMMRGVPATNWKGREMEDQENPMTGMDSEEKEQYVAEQAMQIILNSGDARTLANEAFSKICEGAFDEAADLLRQADRTQVKAHNIQTAMIQGDIRGGEERLGYFVLFAHAQDTLMTIQTELNLTKNILRLAQATDERISELEARVARS